MRAFMVITPLLVGVFVDAFEIRLSKAKGCRNPDSHIQLNVAQGCNQYWAVDAQAIILPWLSSLDNDVLLATYSDTDCCHATLIESYGWNDTCNDFKSQGVGSWRVLDPENLDNGPSGQAIGYACDLY
ncbi:hypothetical protein P154DRAFT_579684 [Amniculicola lignicola CBS 123094]|uniref:Ecp2 effector protein domain-containing protein n=1 Tax=Amniculicola lignicola CBS 123094 TaxID=1392246 RepID=A0A6A5W3X0_9PLEO|nr:hypothetical protein P154DRAFT_579684 [Amniculicola lignicola CBS 123094]